MSYMNSINYIIVIVNITCAKVEQPIASLRISSAGCDRIPIFVAGECIPSMIEPLTYVINKSFTEGICHRELKFATIVHTMKVGDPTQITYYRPTPVIIFFL